MRVTALLHLFSLVQEIVFRKSSAFDPKTEDLRGTRKKSTNAEPVFPPLFRHFRRGGGSSVKLKKTLKKRRFPKGKFSLGLLKVLGMVEHHALPLGTVVAGGAGVVVPGEEGQPGRVLVVPHPDALVAEVVGRHVDAGVEPRRREAAGHKVLLLLAPHLRQAAALAVLAAGNAGVPVVLESFHVRTTMVLYKVYKLRS